MPFRREENNRGCAATIISSLFENMETAAQGLLQALPLLQRIKVDQEIEEIFTGLTDALEEVRHGWYDLERLLDDTFHGKDR